MKTEHDFPIDFVVTWVNQNDSEWQNKKNEFSNCIEGNIRTPMNSEERYRDFGIFKYWFRSVEKYAPWVNKIYVVTDHQIPEFLNITSGKIQIVSHEDFIPNEFLPTFNSNVIELFLDRIPGIANHFVYFNDDIYINGPVEKSFFFSIDGLPKDAAIQIPMQPVSDFEHIPLNVIKLINQKFDKRSIQNKYFSKFINIKYGLKYNIETILLWPFKKFSMFQFQHTAYSLRKKDFANLDLHYPNVRQEIGYNRFRSNSDVSLWLIQALNFVSGNFIPRSTKSSKYLTVKQLDAISCALNSGEYKVIIVNDINVNNFSVIKLELKKLFEKKFGEKSIYEL